MLPDARDYDELRRKFRWQVPARYNIGVDCCDTWAEQDPQRLAILHVHGDGHSEDITYGWLRETSNRFANVLAAHGIGRGDRVAILLPQAPEVAAAHLAIYKLGGVALPLASLFGIDALSYRLQNSGAKAIVTDTPGLAKLAEIRADLPALGLTLSIDGAADGALDFHASLVRASTEFTAVDTTADDRSPSALLPSHGRS
jgi:acetyl-CoA synthetase